MKDSLLHPINQVASIFFNRQIIDDHYGGLAFEEEGEIGIVNVVK